MALSKAKAGEVAKSRPESLVIAADTVVWAEGRILGKPKDEAEARAMLHMLSDNTHEVYTGVTVVLGGKTMAGAECTKVFFRRLTDEEIDRCVSTGEPMDKAGAYGIQGRAALMVRRRGAITSMLWVCRCAGSAKCSKRSGCIFLNVKIILRKRNKARRHSAGHSARRRSGLVSSQGQRRSDTKRDR